MTKISQVARLAMQGSKVAPDRVQKIERFAEVFDNFRDTDLIIDRLLECQQQQFASEHWLSEATLNLSGLWRLAAEMLDYLDYLETEYRGADQ